MPAMIKQGAHHQLPDGFIAYDDNGNELMRYNTVAAAVNFIDLSNAITGEAPRFIAAGDDTNIDIIVDGKGTGRLKNAAGQDYLVTGEGGTPGELNDIGDVDVATAAENDFLVRNASDTWVNLTPTQVRAAINVENGATADQTADEIRTLVESASDSNVFTDADHSKLDGIEAGATGDQNAAEIRALVEAATDSNVFTDADHSKLDGIEANATADQTAAEIRVLVDAATDSNVFTDADHSKLDGIEALATADQTDVEIEALYEGLANTNKFTDADKAKLDALIGGTNNLTATTDPGTGDDSDDGYQKGSRWLNTNSNEWFTCLDATVGAAVWQQTTLTIDELAAIAVSGSASDLITGTLPVDRVANGSLPLAKLDTDPLARANHTGTQLMTTISDAGDLAILDTVDTGQIQDAAVTLAKMATQAEGQVIAFDALGNAVIVSAGTEGQVLTANASGAPSFQDNAGGSTLGTSWTFKTDTAEADPGNGNLRLDNVTIGSVTEIYVDDQNKDGSDVSAILTSMPVNTKIYFQETENSANSFSANLDAVTDATGYVKYEITIESSSGAVPSNNAEVSMLFFTPSGGGGPTTWEEDSNNWRPVTTGSLGDATNPVTNLNATGYIKGGLFYGLGQTSDPTAVAANEWKAWSAHASHGTKDDGDVWVSSHDGTSAKTLKWFDHDRGVFANPQESGSMNFLVDDNDESALATGAREKMVYVLPCKARTDVRWRVYAPLAADSAGNCEFDILKGGTSIIGVTGTPESPNLTSSKDSSGTDFSDWTTTTGDPGDKYTINLTDNAGGFGALLLTLEWERIT